MAKGGSTAVKPSTTTTTSSTGLNPQAQPYYSTVLDAGQKAFDAGTNQSVGDVYAGPNATQTQALGDLKTLAPTLSAGAAPLAGLAGQNVANSQGLSDYGNSVLKGDFLNSNPALMGMIDAKNRSIMEDLQRRVLPGLADKDMMEGAYGGTRGELAQGQAIGDAIQAMQDQSAGLIYADYNNERTRQNDVGSIFTQVGGLGTTAGSIYGDSNDLALKGTNTLGLAGDQEQQWAQQLLDAQQQVDLPWDQINNFMKLLQMGGTSGSSTAVTTPGVNPTSSAPAAYQGAMGQAATLAGLGGSGWTSTPSVFAK